MPRIDPSTVVSPKAKIRSVQVLFDSAEENFSIARLHWEGDPNVLAIRWNGDKDSNLGTPHAMGKPTWFVIPRALQSTIQDWLDLQEHGNRVIEGYKAMAADKQREAEANEWLEGLLGDTAQG